MTDFISFHLISSHFISPSSALYTQATRACSQLGDGTRQILMRCSTVVVANVVVCLGERRVILPWPWLCRLFLRREEQGNKKALYFPGTGAASGGFGTLLFSARSLRICPAWPGPFAPLSSPPKKKEPFDFLAQLTVGTAPLHCSRVSPCREEREGGIGLLMLRLQFASAAAVGAVALQRGCE